MIYRCKLSTNMKRPQTFQKIVSYHIEWDSFNSINFMIDRSNAVNLENMSYPFVCLHTSLVSFVCLLWVFMLGTHCHWSVGFFIVQHLLWHGISINYGISEYPWHSHLFAERLAVEPSLLVFTTKVCRVWDSKTQSFACEANTLTNSATAAAFLY